MHSMKGGHGNAPEQLLSCIALVSRVVDPLVKLRADHEANQWFEWTHVTLGWLGVWVCVYQCECMCECECMYIWVWVLVYVYVKSQTEKLYRSLVQNDLDMGQKSKIM